MQIKDGTFYACTAYSNGGGWLELHKRKYGSSNQGSSSITHQSLDKSIGLTQLDVQVLSPGVAGKHVLSYHVF